MGTKEKHNPQWMGVVNALRENDLLLLSKDKIDDITKLLDFSSSGFKSTLKSLAYNPEETKEPLSEQAMLEKIFDPNRGRVL